MFPPWRSRSRPFAGTLDGVPSGIRLHARYRAPRSWEKAGANEGFALPFRLSRRGGKTAPRPGLPCFRMVNVPNTQKSEKVRWGRGDLSGLFLLTTLSEPYLHGETAVKEICVRPMSIWWRRGELNSRPKTHPQELLRAQTVIAGVLLSPFPSPRASRHARGSGELHDAWYAQSLAYARPPLNDA